MECISAESFTILYRPEQCYRCNRLEEEYHGKDKMVCLPFWRKKRAYLCACHSHCSWLDDLAINRWSSSLVGLWKHLEQGHTEDKSTLRACCLNTHRKEACKSAGSELKVVPARKIRDPWCCTVLTVGV